ncbi:MAG TPA: hypothetical protein VG692_09950 [Gemmatimonadales bacterium]|nr:hypothetical protein [Gemmatimonadales bacterium]
MRLYYLAGMGVAAVLLACEAPASDNPVANGLTPAAVTASSHGGHDHDMEHERGHFATERELFRLRRDTDQFHSIPRAERAGYAAFGPCFDNPGVGGMGYHWANQALIGDSAIDVRKPELLVYRPTPDGGRQLAAVEYIVFVDEWHAKGHVNPPKLFGLEFHINPTLLEKPFYLLHVWAWYPNPSGTFMDWNPRVSCS